MIIARGHLGVLLALGAACSAAAENVQPWPAGLPAISTQTASYWSIWPAAPEARDIVIAADIMSDDLEKTYSELDSWVTERGGSVRPRQGSFELLKSVEFVGTIPSAQAENFIAWSRLRPGATNFKVQRRTDLTKKNDTENKVKELNAEIARKGVAWNMLPITGHLVALRGVFLTRAQDKFERNARDAEFKFIIRNTGELQ